MSGTPAPFPHLTDLLSEQLGGRALACSDDFFASMTNLTKASEAVFDPDAYYERGKVMDGWESRRKRGPGHDWCILKLGAAGMPRAVDLDTSHFTGNHAPWASIEACEIEGDPTAEYLQNEARWVEILPAVALRLGSHNPFPIAKTKRVTHIRLNIFPDGGVARIRLYGDVVKDLSGEVDLAALENGAKALACSDMYFGVMDHLLMPGRAQDMRGGWETRRRRGPGEDWVLIRLAARGVIHRLQLDTNHFKGNFPDTAIVEGIDWQEGPPHALLESRSWQSVLPRHKLRAHAIETVDVDDSGPFTHLRLRIAPCGGVSRLRAFGTKAPEKDEVVDRYNVLDETEAIAAFQRCCGSHRWARRMSESRPFAHRGALLSRALHIWWTLTEDDWREAFAHHPRIGDDPARLVKKFGDTADLAAKEQAGVVGASDALLKALATENIAYEEKFGHVFLVCATGKSAQEMLDICRYRMPNTPERELREAANEQAQITAIRLLAGGHP